MIESLKACLARRPQEVDHAMPSMKEIQEVYPDTSNKYRKLYSLDARVVYDRALVIVDTSRREASPGAPMSRFGSTVGQVIEKFGRKRLAQLVTSIILLLEVESRGWEWNEPCPPSFIQNLLDKGLCEVIELFTKGEPVPQRKLETKTSRLIWPVGLVSNCVERVLYDYQNKTEIDVFQGGSQTIPSVVGMGGDDSNLRRIQTRIMSMTKPCGADVQKFDISVTYKELMWDADCRVALAGAEGTPLARVMRFRTAILAHSLVRLPGGSLVRILRPGIQKSGSGNTSSSNSRIRFGLARAAGASECISNGDDTVESRIPNPFEAYAAIGHPIREYTTFGEGEMVEFCSTYYGPVFGDCSKLLPFPASVLKTIFRHFGHKSECAERSSGLRFFLRNHPLRTSILTIVDKAWQAHSTYGSVE